MRKAGWRPRACGVPRGHCPGGESPRQTRRESPRPSSAPRPVRSIASDPVGRCSPRREVRVTLNESEREPSLSLAPADLGWVSGAVDVLPVLDSCFLSCRCSTATATGSSRAEFRVLGALSPASGGSAARGRVFELRGTARALLPTPSRGGAPSGAGRTRGAAAEQPEATQNPLQRTEAREGRLQQVDADNALNRNHSGFTNQPKRQSPCHRCRARAGYGTDQPSRPGDDRR
jgi:hypothetical protein